MSKAGYHWPPREEKRDTPCFKCGTEPRLEAHKVCSSCHREETCPYCHPGLAYTTPANQSRGVATAEHSRIRMGAE